MLSECRVCHPLQGRWKFTMPYLQQFVWTYILNTALGKKNYAAFAPQTVVHWAPGAWMNPCGFHKSIIPLPVSALQAGGSPDCGHTARLPGWMNCSKVMPCTKSLPGNKAQQILMHCNCAREICLWTTNTGKVVSGTCDVHMQQKWCWGWLIISDLWAMNTPPFVLQPSNYSIF